MGGLVARSYVEDIGSEAACYNYGSNPFIDPSSPNYVNGLCRPGRPPANYTSDIADIITLDTPHGGTALANASLGFPQCWLGGGVSASKSEMEPNSQLLQTLNYYASLDYLSDSGLVSRDCISNWVAQSSQLKATSMRCPILGLMVAGLFTSVTLPEMSETGPTTVTMLFPLATKQFGRILSRHTCQTKLNADGCGQPV